MVLLDDEDPAELGAFAAALRAERAPEGPLQADLVARIVSAAWRADRLEAARLDRHPAPARPDGARAASGEEADPQGALGAGLIRDGNGPRALETLLRYRGAVQAELFRVLAALKALQAEARDVDPAGPRAATLPAGLPALPAPARTTKRTRESMPDQRLEPQTARRSAA